MSRFLRRHPCFGALLCAALFLLGGCVTVPTGQKGFPYPTVSVRDKPYFVLRTMCEAEHLSWDYDPLSQVVILRKDAREVRLMVDADIALVGGEVKKMSGPLVIEDSTIYAPIDFRTIFEPAVCKFPAQEAPPAGGYLRPVNFVMLDPGHGGKDPGAIGRGGLKEKGVVLDVAEKVRAELERCGLRVEATRSSDVFVPLDERAGFANTKKADLFVSIHANANRSRWIEGFEVYYLTETVDDDARALAAAEDAPLGVDEDDWRSAFLSLKATLWDMIYTENRRESIELAYALSRSVSKKLNLKLLGVKGAPFAVLKGTRMPAVLVEIGYISNKDGERHLRDAEYRQRMAEAIAEGIMEFKRYAEGK